MYEASNILKRIMLPILSKGPSKGAKTRFQILRFPPSNPIQASFLPACTGDAGDSVCLSHFLDAISQGERIHHQMFKLISPCFSKGELSPLDWPWMNKRATEGGLTGRGGCLCLGEKLRESSLVFGADFISPSVRSQLPRQRRCGGEISEG